MVDDVVRIELGKLLAGDILRRSPTQCSLLRYLVERRLAEDWGALKEIAIGVAVFGRDPATFDPKRDTIVRVRVRRLREKLKQHYARIGDAATVVIELPKGRFVPIFTSSEPSRERSARLLFHPVRSRSSGVEDLADLLFEQALDILLRANSFKVLAPRTARSLAEAAPLDAGARVDADAVLESELSRENGLLAVTCRLLSARDGRTIAAWKVSSPAGGRLGAFVDLFAQRVVEACVAHLQRSPHWPIKRVRKGFEGVADAAIELFLQARRCTGLGTQDGFGQAREHLERAIEICPGFALAHAYHAAAIGNLMLHQQISATEAWERSTASSRRALELDPHDVNVHVNLAADAFFYEFDFAAAWSLLGRARELSCNHPGLHHMLAIVAGQSGRFDESLELLRLAEEVDPLNVATRSNRGIILYFARRFDDSIRVLKEVLAHYPDRSVTRTNLGVSLAMTGAYSSAIDELECSAAQCGDDLGVRSAIASVHALAGDQRKASAILGELVNSRLADANPCEIARIHAQLGHVDEAVDWLDRGAQAHDPLFAAVQVEPLYDPLAGDRRFRELLGRYAMRPLQPAGA